MLSRVAESIYWMARYVERAENVARFIDVNLKLMLDNPDVSSAQWEPLVLISGDDEMFTKTYGKDFSQDNVIKFLTFDTENPNSIISCLRSARWNARSVREVISQEMWLQLNKFYLMVNAVGEQPALNISLDDFFSEVKNSSHLFQGVTDGTMTHGEGWHFCRLGSQLERADKTSRIVDVKYFILLRSVEDVGTALDDLQWAAVLRSNSAFHMYRRDRGRVTPKGVVDYLLLDRHFPRAIHHCLLAAQESLHAISGTPIGAFRNPAEKLLGQLTSELSYAAVDDIINGGLHEYLDELQDKMNKVGNGVHETFFADKAPPHMNRNGMSQSQSQSQSGQTQKQTQF
jgi:uncharacterized alpha-E superfamily protein